MNTFNRIQKVLGASLGAAAIVLAGCAMMSPNRNVGVSLSGAEQVPPVNTAARGTGSFTVGDDRSVSGSVTISGLAPVAAHIHTGKRGANGPIAVGMTKSSDTVWAIPAGSKFTEDQYKAFLAGDTYVNVHTAANKGGEIRAQLQP